MVVTGLEHILDQPELAQGAGRLGLLYNQASIDKELRSAPELISAAFPNRLTTLFGPQHGVAGTEQDNMRETGHSVHPTLGLPIYSLYSTGRKPSIEMLREVDTVLVDLQDVGTRVYTFATTVLYLMEACADAGKKIVILDRPNPINGEEVEGNVLDPACASFVGPYPIPMRHGMTLGELMTLYNEVHSVGCTLKVIPVSGWDRSFYFDQTGLPWILPSPNMPSVETAVVYPGQVILEGTNLSEGRGTTRPFEIFGAPYVDPADVLAATDKKTLTGTVLRTAEFQPAFNKWAGQPCRGFQIHVIDRHTFKPYRATLGLISAILQRYPAEFSWSAPPYEYVFDKLPVDVILGDLNVRAALEAGCSVLEMEREWAPDLEQFKRVRSKFLLTR